MLFLLLFSKLASAGYIEKTDGFYLKHFARSSDLKNESCYQFNGRIYRGGQPDLTSNEWLQKLKENNIEWVVDLRSEAQGKTQERDILQSEKIKYSLIPISTGRTNSPETVNLLKQNLTEIKNFNGNIYIHCQRGEDRTGLVIGLLRNCPDWKREFLDYGGVLYKPLEKIYNELGE